jgi:uncharacterized membrane protein YgcG
LRFNFIESHPLGLIHEQIYGRMPQNMKSSIRFLNTVEVSRRLSMSDFYTHKIKMSGGDPRRRTRYSAAALFCLTLFLAGCAHVPAEQQRMVSKPNMQFYEATMFNSLNRLVIQFESSSASSMGGQSSGGVSGGGGCSACGG